MKNSSKTLDKSRLFKNAWTMVKKYDMTMSSALKKSWKYEKEKMNQKDTVILLESELVRETEKAMLVKCYNDRTYSFWLPKSQAYVNADGLVEISSWLVAKKENELADYYSLPYVSLWVA